MTARATLIFLFLALPFLPASLHAVTVEVVLDGVEGGLYENVMAHLSVQRHATSPRLTNQDVRRLHKKAGKEIREALAPLGYYNPRVTSDMDEDGETFMLMYHIDKGEPVVVREVHLQIEGDQNEAIFADVKSQFPVQAGDVLNQGLYENGKKAILRKALNNGFLEARFLVQQIRVDRQALAAEVRLTLDPGRRFAFGATTFSGSEMDQELLEKYMPYRKGAPYRTADLIELQKVLYRTGFFNRVIVEGKVEDRKDFAVPVVVHLTVPEKRNQYSVGAGYATDTGVRARFEWRNRLLNDKGHAISGTVQASERDSILGMDYKVPWGNMSNDRIAYSASYNEQNWDDTETRLISLGVGLEHKTQAFTYGGAIEFRDEDYSVGVTEGKSKLIMPSLTGNFIFADDFGDTSRGVQISTSVSGAVEDVGSDTTFIKGVVGGKLIVTPIPGWRLIGRGSLGATAVDSIDDLPPSLRFYAGGDYSIRGYGYKEIGSEDESGAVVGGRYLAIGSVEAEKEFRQDWSFAMFWDVGNATDDLGLDFKQGVGAGIRYRLPFGQVRLDVACAILEEDTPFRLHLTAGADL